MSIYGYDDELYIKECEEKYHGICRECPYCNHCPIQDEWLAE